MSDLFEELSAIEHQRWADWQRHVFSICEPGEEGVLIIPKWAVKKWSRQIETEYKDLSETEKNKDRNQVMKYWYLVMERTESIDLTADGTMVQ